MNITRGSSISVRAYDVKNGKNVGIIWLGSTGGEWKESVFKFATCDSTNISIIIDNGSSADTYAMFDNMVLNKLK